MTRPYEVKWSETVRTQAKPSSFDGFFDAHSAGARGLYRVVSDGVLVDQVGDPVQVKKDELIRVLVGDDASKYGMEDWVYAVGESLQVDLDGRIESILPNTLVAVLPSDLEKNP